jgi:hypothetical protein
MYGDGVHSIIRLHPTDSGWEIFENGRLAGRDHPTVDSAIEAANAIHRMDVERFLNVVDEPTTEPVSEKHKNGDLYLTDAGWARWITREEAIEHFVFRKWYLCNYRTLDILFEAGNPIGVTPKFVFVPTPHRGNPDLVMPKVASITYAGPNFVYSIQEAQAPGSGWEIFRDDVLVSSGHPTQESATKVVSALHLKDVETPAVDSPTSSCATAAVTPAVAYVPCVSQEPSSSVEGAMRDTPLNP